MKKNINLLPVELQKKVFVKTQKNLIVVLISLIIGAVFIGFTGFFAWIKFCEYRVTGLDQDLRTVMPKDVQEKQYQEENKQLKTELANLEKILAGRINWTTILQDMNNRLPKEMWITGFSYGQEGKIRITGLTGDVAGIGIFIFELNQLKYLSDLSLGKVTEVKAGDTILNEFSLVGTLVKGSE